MNERQSKQMDMLARVLQFADTHATQFPPGTAAADVVATIRRTVDELTANAMAKASAKRRVREGVASRTAARETLRTSLETIRRTARGIPAIPHAAETFRVPKPGRDRVLLQEAKVIAETASPYRAEFARFALTDAFFAKFDADIAALESALATQRRSRESRVESTASIGKGLAAAIGAVRDLDRIVRNTFGPGSPAVAAWASASRVARSPRPATPIPAETVSASPSASESEEVLKT